MLHPAILLGALCCCTIFLFGDRGVLASNAVSGGDPQTQESGIRATFDLTIAQSGWTYACLMVGLAVSAPIAAYLGKSRNALRVIAGGVLLSALGAAGTGAAPSFILLCFFRTVTGLGCGPFISLASPLIDDTAPKERKSAYLSILFLCLPVGFAFGFVWGSAVAQHFGWRIAFFTEALALLVCGIICLVLPVPRDGINSADCGIAINERISVLADLKELSNSTVIWSILAIAMLNGSIGGFSFYGPKAAKEIFKLQAGAADTLFGIVTVIMGTLGTMCGGVILDYYGANVRVSLIVCVIGLFLASVAIAVAFTWSTKLITFCLAFALGEGFMFATSAPATGVLLWSVTPTRRPVALALSEICNHLLGDVPLPPLLGLFQQAHHDWKLTMVVCTSALATSSLLFLIATWTWSGNRQDQGGALSIITDEGDSVEYEEGRSTLTNPSSLMDPLIDSTDRQSKLVSSD